MRKSLLMVAALAAMGCVPAHAVSTASAVVGPLTVTLYDLDPLDGVTPGVVFSAVYPGLGNFVQATAYNSLPYQYDYNAGYGWNSFDPAAVSAMTSMSGAAASVAGPGTAVGTTVSASGHAVGTTDTVPFGYQYSNYSAYAYAPYYSYGAFSLTKNTAMVISAASVMSTSVTNSYDPALTHGYENAYAGTQLYIYGPAPSGGSGYQTSVDSFVISAGSASYSDAGCGFGYCYGPNAASDTRTLSVSFVNFSTGDMNGQFQAYATVNGTSYAQVVPEPETAAMMLGGLLTLGFVGRRRRGH